LLGPAVVLCGLRSGVSPAARVGSHPSEPIHLREYTMFTGEESIRFKSDASESKVYDEIEDALSSLGDAVVDNRGDIDIRPRQSLTNAFTEIKMGGSVRLRGGKYIVSVDYTCGLSSTGLVILILGVLFFLVGVLVLLAPLMAKENVSKAVRRALRDLD